MKRVWIIAAALIAAPLNTAWAAVDDEPTPFAGATLDESALAGIAGREDLQQAATSSQVAGVSRNSVGDNSKTGDVSVADNAFQNLSGLSVLNVNTGNNVAINASMNVNIAINPN